MENVWLYKQTNLRRTIIVPKLIFEIECKDINFSLFVYKYVLVQDIWICFCSCALFVSIFKLIVFVKIEEIGCTFFFSWVKGV